MQKLINVFPARFLRDKVLRTLFFAGLLLFVGSFIFVLLKVNLLSLPVILHFDVMSGVDRFGDQSSVWGVWGLGFVLFIINSILGEMFLLRERALSFVCFGANLFLSILFLIILSVIITVN